MYDDREAWRRANWTVQDAVEGGAGQNAQAVMKAIGAGAAAIARALRRGEDGACPDMDGPPLSQADGDMAVIEARRLLETVADLFGAAPDPVVMREYAFEGRLVKRADWKPVAKMSVGAARRYKAAARVYELMAAQAIESGQAPKQEAAIHAVLAETGLSRSKLMQGLREYREWRAQLVAWREGKPFDPDQVSKEQRDDGHWFAACFQMERIYAEACENDCPPDLQD